MSTNQENTPIKHSPGPWKAEMFKDENDERWHVLADNGTQPYLIAVIENGQPGDTMETEGATARLMASAPELLEALKDVLSWIENWDADFKEEDEWLEARQKARAAIAKAEGKE